MANTSKSHYVGHNARGAADRDTASAVMVLVGIFVFLRLWGRFKYSSPGDRSWPQFGESRFWILLSDLTLLLSFLSGLALTIIIDNAVAWGFGIHIKELSITQIHNVMQMFFMFQIFYKWTAGISKVASCFLFLAIATPQMTRFKTACYVLIVYQGLLSLCAAVATVFQCGLDIESNYISTNNQSHCFPKPPFWYAHGALTIVSSMCMVTLPVWLFADIAYKRKWSIAGVMTALAIAELILSCVRLKGLVETAHNLTDIPYSATTGLLISQLEVDFGIVAACIPTISKLLDEYMSRLFYCVTGRERPIKSDGYSKSTSRTPKSTIHLDNLSDRIQGSKYTQFGVEIDTASVDSQGSQKKLATKGHVTSVTTSRAGMN